MVRSRRIVRSPGYPPPHAEGSSSTIRSLLIALSRRGQLLPQTGHKEGSWPLLKAVVGDFLSNELPESADILFFARFARFPE